MKKIALVIDVEDWAFANIAKNIKENLSKYFEFKIIPIANLENNVAKVLIEAEECDLIHFFWRGVILQINSDEYKRYIEDTGRDINKFNQRYLYNKIITSSVPDHLFLENDIEITKEIFSKCSNYYVSSNKLLDIYKNMELENYPYGVISDGVNLKEFYFKNKRKYDNINNRKIKIGWVGNSAWHTEKEDFKGVNTILKPVLRELIEEGYSIETCFADKQDKMIPHNEMVDYYSNIDILVCTSKFEGTPCPVLEGMACGNVIVSTDVGIVKEALGKKQSEFILKERTKECLKQKLIYLIENREIFEELSKENLEQIKKWSWTVISKKIKDFYDYTFQKETSKKMRGEDMNNIKELEMYKREINKLQISLEATTKENEYMKKNIKKTTKELKKIKNSKAFKISKAVKKVKNKLEFWRKK